MQEQFFRNIFIDLKNKGKMFSPRGMKTLEIENFSCEIHPRCRFMNFESRKLNLNYIKKEFLWYLKADKFDTSICEYAKLWKDLINKDGSINSNYGQYIFGKVNQFENVVKILREDKDTRRACISILSKEHLLSETKDYPCTVYLNFHIRDNKLNMFIKMRSQDAVFGLGNDLPTFSFIYEMMLNKLDGFYKGLSYGKIYHNVDSFHVYERHFDMLEKIINGDKFEEIDCPRIYYESEVDSLIKNEEKPPIYYKFSNWLRDIK